MTKIDLSKFIENNYDEFVHLRALKNVIDQIDVINEQQDTNITHAQSTADTAQKTATLAQSNAEKAQESADKAQQTADRKSSISYQKEDGTTVFAPVMTIADVKHSSVDNGKTSIGKALVCLDQENRPIDMGEDNQMLSVQGADKMFISNDTKDEPIEVNSTIQDISDSGVQFVLNPVVLHNGTIDDRIEDLNIFGKMNIDDLISTHALRISLAESLDDRIAGSSCMANLHIIGKNLITLPVTLNFNSSSISVSLNENYTTEILTGAGLSTGTTYSIQIQ